MVERDSVEIGVGSLCAAVKMREVCRANERHKMFQKMMGARAEAMHFFDRFSFVTLFCHDVRDHW